MLQISPQQIEMMKALPTHTRGSRATLQIGVDLKLCRDSTRVIMAMVVLKKAQGWRDGALES